ncbi:MAG: FAD binding domain-containing protein [Ferruginibacter sp.]|nr:FAD binding domain-containing protein [Ferruginibacter sp.]
MIQFLLNDRLIQTAVPAGTLVLDFVRYQQRLTGTKIGCREGDCGACTVLIGELKNGRLFYSSVTSCLMPIGNAANKHIVTIEGINATGLNFLQQAFADEGASQCGFCAPGFIVSATGFAMSSSCNYQDGIDAMNGNICRCTGYKSIERAIGTIAGKLESRGDDDPLSFAIAQELLPAYFSGIKERLQSLQVGSNGYTREALSTRVVVGGGTDLYVQQHDAMQDADIRFVINEAPLKGILQVGDECILGASVTVSEMLKSPLFLENFPALRKYIRLVSSTQIRNMATIAGNLVNASPIGDLTIFFLALDAQVTLSGGDTKRKVPLRQFYKGYKLLERTEGEVIEQISFKIPPANHLFNFEKVSKRTTLDIASVNTAILLTMNGNQVATAGIAAGGVGPIPAYLSAASAFCVGKDPSAEMLAELLEIVQTEIAPISDTRGSAIYKRLLLSQLIKAHFSVLFPGLDLNPSA